MRGSTKKRTGAYYSWKLPFDENPETKKRKNYLCQSTSRNDYHKPGEDAGVQMGAQKNSERRE